MLGCMIGIAILAGFPNTILMAGSTNSAASSGHSGWQPPSVEHLQQLLPQYEITEIIGHGGMGAVYKGRQTQLDRPVAIKLLPESLQDDEDGSFVERFKLEARAMAKLDHPAIISVHDFGVTTEGHLYFVMEFIDGMDLQQYLQASGGKLEPEAAVAIISHVLDALDYAHKHGIVHRDIKPANVLINSEGRVKIADFGLAKQVGGEGAGLTMSNVAMGTPDFIAPEALLDSAASDGRADLYAVGVMLYQMLTGRLPRGMFKLPSEDDASIDPRFDDIIAAAMEPNPEQRIPAAADFRRQLDDLQSQPVTHVPSRSAIQRRGGNTKNVAPAVKGGLPRSAPPGKAGLWIGVAAGVVVLGGGWLVLKPPAPPVGITDQPKTAKSPTSPSADTRSDTRSDTTTTGVPATVEQGAKRPGNAKPSEPAASPQPSAAGPAPAPKEMATQSSSVTPAPAPAPEKTPSKPDESAITALAKIPGFKTRIANYQKARAKQLGDLTAKYCSALNTAKTEATRSGNLAHVEAVEQAARRAANFADMLEELPSVLKVEPLPILPALGESTPESLLKLRSILDQETSKIEAQLSTALGQSLNALQVSLVKAGDLDAARAVDAFRKELDGAPPPSVATAVSPAPASITTMEPFTNSLGMRFVPLPGSGVLMCVHETRRKDYQQYADDVEGVDITWEEPVIKGKIIVQKSDHPVINVSWEDAMAFCAWLSQKEGRTYRLPTSHEFDLAISLHPDPTSLSPEDLEQHVNCETPWGTPDYLEGKAFANYGYNGADPYPGTAPVMSFEPNRHGIYDLSGNTWEWMADLAKNGSDRVLRGSGFTNFGSVYTSSGIRANTPGDLRQPPERDGPARVPGFRVVVESSSAAPASASTTPPPTSAPEPTPDLPSDGYPLFNDRDFTGWQPDNPSAWKVENGALVCRGAVSVLAHPLSATGIDLSGEFRVSSKASGGVVVFATSSSPGEGWEMPIVGSKASSPMLTGGMVDHKTGKQTPPSTNHARDDEWQSFRMLVAAGLSKLWIRGLPSSNPQMGRPIEFPTHLLLRASAANGEVAFRNLSARTLNYPKIDLNDPGTGPEWKPVLADSELNQWKLTGTPADFQLQDGVLKVQVTDRGPSYLFLALGQSRPASIKSFDLMFKARATGQANSGIYFHTDPAQWQAMGHPATGYEVNLANTGPEDKLTGAVYNIVPPLINLPNQSDWFDVRICVADNRVLCLINGRIAQDFVEPDDLSTLPNSASQKDRGFRKSGGAIAIQANSKNSAWFLKDMRFRELD